MSGWSELAHLLKAFAADMEDAVKRGHDAGHSKVHGDAKKMANDVDATEAHVTALVPHGENLTPDPHRYKLGGPGGPPELHDDVHVNTGGYSANHQKVSGYPADPTV